MTTNSSNGSGDGTRPTTSGGIDNIGAGKKMTGKRTAAGEEVLSPAPTERAAGNVKSKEAAKKDDSSAFHLREDLTPESNTEPPPTKD